MQQRGDRQVAAAAIESRDQQHRPYHMSSSLSSPSKLDRNNNHMASPKSPVIRSSLQNNNSMDDHHLSQVNKATQQAPPIKLNPPPPTTITNNDDDDAAADTLISLAQKLPEKRMPTDINDGNEPAKRVRLSIMDTSAHTAAAADYESSTSPSEPRSPPHQIQQHSKSVPPPTQTATTTTNVSNNDPATKEQKDQHQSSPKLSPTTTNTSIVDQKSTADTPTPALSSN